MGNMFKKGGRRASSQPAANGGTAASSTSRKSSRKSGTSAVETMDSKYDMGKALGKGNYSVVKLCSNKKTGETFAVKVMDKKTLAKEDQDAIKVEVGVLKSLQHPNIISLYDVFDEPRYFYLVTELMSGGELFDRIVKKSFYSEQDGQHVVRTIAEVLKYMHSKGIVHRDLKPENILLKDKTENAVVKLADFGFARPVGEGCTTACGTPGYVAPEIISGLKYGTSADCWSLGVIMFILLCGYPPFYNTQQQLLFRTIKQGKFSFDSPYWDPISPEAKDLIKKCLTVDVKQRLTMDKILQHPWLSSTVPETDIKEALVQLRLFNARRKLRAAMLAAIAANRLGDIATTIKAGR